MCGIAGFLATSCHRSNEVLEAMGWRMGQQLLHRGPDSGGTWVDQAHGISLAHRRLAILDLSPDGRQPMCSETGRFVVTYNGEVYNHGALRAELSEKGHTFRGHSDTEVLLAAVEEWGVERALHRFNGMFAFALWDREERLLHLARDRMGEKPLYHGWLNGTFLFASELKALRAAPGFDAGLDRGALALFMRHGYVPSPYSIYEGVRKLEPGGLLTVSPSRPEVSSTTRYWSHRQVAADAIERPFAGTPEEGIAELESLLRDAVKLRMQADVPLGAFLSGGVDSSMVVALMQAQSARPVKTFTIGFEEDELNEAEKAKAVARHLGTDHTELYLGAKDALGVIPRLPALYDEPFADSSQIPTFLVSQLARRSVTVSLSGDGGDELFCGYPRYSKAVAIWKKMRWIPRGLRVLGAETISAMSDAWRAGFGLSSTWAERLDARSRLLMHPTADALYRGLMSISTNPTHLVPGSDEPATTFTDGGARPSAQGFIEWMMFLDALTYLPDDILVKVDRASMGVSLEARVPLLDHRLVQLAWRMPLSLKQRSRTSKWILREILHRYVPRDLFERPKQGFAVPLASWLRGPLRGWASDLLSEERLRRQEYLNPALVNDALREHLSGARDRSPLLWNVLMFEAWLANESGPAASEAMRRTCA
jgi:asparagine synthase (glutamine-hydrolysing)